MVKFYQVFLGGRLRFEGLRLAECEDVATSLYNDEKANPNKIIPEIYEDERVAEDHRRAR